MITEGQEVPGHQQGSMGKDMLYYNQRVWSRQQCDTVLSSVLLTQGWRDIKNDL